MRGCDEMQESLFMVAKLEDFVPEDHPLRPLRDLVNEALLRLNGLFNLIYADTGRASIAPEKLMRALLLQVFYSVRSERMLMEQMRYNLLFRWFVGLAMDDVVWDHSTFSKNRDRLLDREVVEAFFTEVMTLADKQGLLSKEHFGWGKTVGRIRQTVYRGLRRVDQHFKLTMVASNLTRTARLLFAGPQGARR
jgi:transposase